MQKLTHKQLQREATQRLNEFMGQIRNQTSVDVSAKNLGEEGCAYVVEALAFNDRCFVGLSFRDLALDCSQALLPALFNIHQIPLHQRNSVRYAADSCSIQVKQYLACLRFAFQWSCFTHQC